MNANKERMIGYTCAYTPLALIEAAGFVPYRVLPLGDMPDQAGQFLHDNLCPHVKKVLDRVLAGEVPELAGVVLLNSCDAMRRLADAWRAVRPEETIVLVDLPVTADEAALGFFASQLGVLAEKLKLWGDTEFDAVDIENSITGFDELSEKLGRIGDDVSRGRLGGGRAWLQQVYNDCTRRSLSASLRWCDALEVTGVAEEHSGGVPVFLFGNVLPDPAAFEMFASCGAQVVGDDLCTGYRQFEKRADAGRDESVFLRMARNILEKPPCARTFSPDRPGRIAGDTLAAARQCGATGVIGHFVKFCDPYLVRMPMVREEFKKAGMPLLMLEGDCTLRSIGQQRTRIEAFIEMLR